MGDMLLPEYKNRMRVVQPQFTRARAAYRSPISSEQFNLQAELMRYDYTMLRAQLQKLRDDFENNMTNLYEGNISINKGVGVGASSLMSTAFYDLVAKLDAIEARIRRIENKRGF